MRTARTRHGNPLSTIGAGDSILGNQPDKGEGKTARMSGTALGNAPDGRGSGSSKGQANPPAASMEKIMNHQVSRRSLVATAAALATSSVTGNAVAEHIADRHWEEVERQGEADCGAARAATSLTDQDAELHRLEGRYKTAFAALEKARVAQDKAYLQVKSMMPREPQRVRISDDYVKAFNEMQVKHIGNPAHPVAIEQLRLSKDYSRRLQAWNDECAAIAKQYTAKANSAHSRHFKIVDEIANEILAKRARTPAGMLVKFRIHEDWSYEEYELLESLEADIRALMDVAA